MSYENAPQTKLVATHCAVCHKPLCDAVSVEVGMGPVCRKKYTQSDLDAADEESRKAANKLIYEIAAKQSGPEVVEHLKDLFALGFPTVVKAVLKSVAKVKIAMIDDGRYAVKAPYDEAAVAAMRKIPGRRWDREHKVNTFPVSSKGALFALLCKFYEGETAIGPKGPFMVAKSGNAKASDKPDRNPDLNANYCNVPEYPGMAEQAILEMNNNLAYQKASGVGHVVKASEFAIGGAAKSGFNVWKLKSEKCEEGYNVGTYYVERKTV